MIADVAFDVPLAHPFSYRVPDGWTVSPGQRAVAALHGAERLGTVVALRDGPAEGLRPLTRLAEPGPALAPGHLDLVRWIAAESLSSIGSTCAALLPPPPAMGPGGAGAAPPGAPPWPEILVGPGREQRVLERIQGGSCQVLVVTPDVEAARRWAHRLARVDRVVRLDSGVPDAERSAAWRALGDGRVRLATGTRSALLAPLDAGGTIVLLDEHDPAHRPPGPPRIHSREVLLERAARDRRALLMTSATPSVETWRQIEAGRVVAPPSREGPWPRVLLADTRGILRAEPLTPTLSRAVREALAARRRVLLVVSRQTSALACDECGAVLRCAACGIALAYSRTAARLACGVCADVREAPDACPGCAGHRLSPFGWGAERVEHAVRRRFPRAKVARYEPDARRGRRAEAQRAAAAGADIVVGTRGALRLFGPASLGAVGLVSPDQLLRIPDFRASERMFTLVWAAAERVRPDGALVLQSQHPDHHAFLAVARHELAAFYARELEFREELGYPPYRRVAIVTIRPARSQDGLALADAVARGLGASPELTVYPPRADRPQRLRRVVVKGPARLPALVAEALAEFGRSPGRRGMMDVEVDPVEWPV